MTQEKILLICNDPYYLDLYTKRLERIGFSDVVRVAEVVDVIRVINIEKPTLLLLDRNTIAEDDYTLLIRIREQNFGIPLLVFNVSFHKSYELSKFIQGGVYDCLSYDVEELEQVIRQAFERRNDVTPYPYPIVEKVLSQLRELELHNARIYAHLTHSDRYSLLQPGDFVYFIESSAFGKKWMAFCRIEKIVKDESNPKVLNFFS
jgi:CheY-like chemotaxis protein